MIYTKDFIFVLGQTKIAILDANKITDVKNILVYRTYLKDLKLSSCEIIFSNTV